MQDFLVVADLRFILLVVPFIRHLCFLAPRDTVASFLGFVSCSFCTDQNLGIVVLGLILFAKILFSGAVLAVSVEAHVAKVLKARWLHKDQALIASYLLFFALN